MYLHLGQETIVNTQDVLGILDIDATSISKHTRDFLNQAEKNGKVINVSQELPKSYIVTGTGPATKVYISQISSTTLVKRSGYLEDMKIEKKKEWF